MQLVGATTEEECGKRFKVFVELSDFSRTCSWRVALGHRTYVSSRAGTEEGEKTSEKWVAWARPIEVAQMDGAE